MYQRIVLSVTMTTLLLLAGCELMENEARVDPLPNVRKELLQQIHQVNRFVLDYVVQTPAIRAGKHLSSEERRALLREALLAYEQTSGIEGVVQGFDYATTYLNTAKRLDGIDSLLDDEQKRWLETLRTLFEEAHTLSELEDMLSAYEQDVQEALGNERATPLLYYSASLYATAYMIFGNDPVLDSLRTLLSSASSGKRKTSIATRGMSKILCELNGIPRLSDYFTLDEELMDALLRGGIAGCITGIGYAMRSGWFWIKAGCVTGFLIGTGVELYWEYDTASEIYEANLLQWCRENQSVCQNNEQYHLACDEVMQTQ